MVLTLAVVLTIAIARAATAPHFGAGLTTDVHAMVLYGIEHTPAKGLIHPLVSLIGQSNDHWFDN